MGNIIAKFPEKIFFAIKDGKNYIENNFYFSFFKRENLQSPEKTNEGIDEIPLIVFIHGLERLFEKNSLSNPIDEFCQKLESSEDGWEITHEKDTDYGECLIVSYNQKKGDLNQEKRDLLNVTFQLREKFVFQQSFSDKEAIGITIIFKNFDNLFPDLDNEIIQDYIITAVELPDFLPAILDTNGNNVSSIFYGEKAQIKWEQGNYKKCSISLYDELGEKTEIKNNYIDIPIIDRDRRFSLEVEKDGLVKSFIIPIYRSRWERESVFNNDFFSHEVIKNSIINFFHYSNEKIKNRYFIYIHPKIYFSEDFAKWKEDSFKIQDFQEEPHSYTLIFLDRAGVFCFCYNCDKSLFISYYLINSTPNLNDNHIYKISKEKLYKGNDEKFLFCYASKIFIWPYFKDVLYVVYTQSIYITLLDDDSSIDLNLVTRLPENVEKTNIVSIDILEYGELEYQSGVIYKKKCIALLCNNGCVYIFSSSNYNKQISDGCYKKINGEIGLKLKSNNQKKIFLIKTDSIDSFYIVLDDYVYILNEKDDQFEAILIEDNNSPLNIIPNKQYRFVAFGPKIEDNFSTISAIVGNDKETILWTLKNDKTKHT